jgi:hypothetical protein
MSHVEIETRCTSIIISVEYSQCISKSLNLDEHYLWSFEIDGEEIKPSYSTIGSIIFFSDILKNF